VYDMKKHDGTPPNGSPLIPDDPGEHHQREVQSLEEAVFHETTQHAPKHHPQNVQAVPPTARSQQRRFPR
jgi:hypothetical protein